MEKMKLNKYIEGSRNKPFTVNNCAILGIGTMTVNRRWDKDSFVSSRLVLSILTAECTKSGRINKTLQPLAHAFKNCKDGALAQAWEKYTNYSVVPSPLADIRMAETLVELSNKYSALPILSKECEKIETALNKYGDFKSWRESVKKTIPEGKKSTPAEKFAEFATRMGEDFKPLALAWIKAHETDEDGKRARNDAKAKQVALNKATRDELVKGQAERIKALESELAKANKAIATAIAEKAKAESSESAMAKILKDVRFELQTLKEGKFPTK